MSDFTNFYKGDSEDTYRVKLPLLFDGQEQEEWVDVYSERSKQYRVADRTYLNSAYDFISKLKEKGIDINSDEGEILCTEFEVENILIRDASLIAGWSFDNELTNDMKIKLLRDIPEYANLITRNARDRNNFLSKNGQSSKNTQKVSSRSKKK